MSNNSNLNKEKKDFRCKTCPREETYRIEVITRLVWEEHHHDYSKSILNPLLQYQALFLINEKDSTDKPITNIKRICFPEGWMLKGEDIIDIRINNSYCSFFNCAFQDEEKHLVVDLQNAPLSTGDSFYFIANIQDIWSTKVEAFSSFLDRFIIFNNELKNSDKQKNSENGSNNDEEKRRKKKTLELLQKKINTDYLEEAYTKKPLFKSKKYIFHYLIYCTPMKKIDLVDYWIKIPNICEIEESCVWDSNSEKTCEMIVDEKYLSILNRKKLKKILQDVPEIEEIQNSELKKVKKLYQEKIDSLKINSSEENLSEELKEDGFKEIGRLRYQSSEVDHQLYHQRVENLTTSILIRNVLKFKKEILRWYRLPLFLSVLQIILALGYLFCYDFIMYFLPEFNSWVFLTFSINILTLLLISLNWGTIQHLRLFKPGIYSKYLTYILVSLTILIVAIIFQPFIREFYKFILGDI